MPLNSLKRPPYWNSTSGFDFDHITAVDTFALCHRNSVCLSYICLSFCTSPRNFIQIGPPSAEKMTVDFQDGGCQPYRFSGSNNGFFEKPNYITSYRSSIATIALNCLVFEKIAFFCILATDRQTDRQTLNKQMDSIDTLSRSHRRQRRLNNKIINCL